MEIIDFIKVSSFKCMFIHTPTLFSVCARIFHSYKHTHHGNTYLTPLHLFYPLKYGAWHTTIINIICVYVRLVLCIRAFISHHHHRRLNIVQWTKYHSRLVSLDPLAYVVQIFFLILNTQYKYRCVSSSFSV